MLLNSHVSSMLEFIINGLQRVKCLVHFMSLRVILNTIVSPNYIDPRYYDLFEMGTPKMVTLILGNPIQ